MAARHGPVAMAAHQIWMQVWLAVSLLSDALAASGQVLNHPLSKIMFIFYLLFRQASLNLCEDFSLFESLFNNLTS